MLQRRGRASYRALKRQFDLDEDYLEDLKAELMRVHQLAVDQNGEMLVRSGEAASTPALTVPAACNAEQRVQRAATYDAAGR